jgi:hypothetical protein
LIFASDSNLQHLRSAQNVSMDGTFRTVPSIYQQLFTVHAFFDNRLLPLVYVLMARKSTRAYVKVFKSLKSACTNLGLQLQPDVIMSDFETGLHDHCDSTGISYNSSQRLPFSSLSGEIY